jgi:HK97 family phage prohead protease
MNMAKRHEQQKKEHWVVTRSDFKAGDDGNGYFEGYANDFGILDEYDDIVLAGAYADTLEEFKQAGWSTTDHTWGVKDEIGLISDAYEDSRGLFFRSEYHPSLDAQQIRLKVNNRLSKGKAVRLSIGYIALKYRYVSGKEAIQYLTPEQQADEAVLARLKRTPRVRLIEKIRLFEVSLVSVPAEPQAAVTAAKSAHEEVIAVARPKGMQMTTAERKAAARAHVKGLFEDVLEARTNSFWNLTSVLYECVWQVIFEDELAEYYGEDYDLEAALRDCLAEFNERIVFSVVGADEEEDAGLGIDAEALSAPDRSAAWKRAAAASLHDSRSETVVATVQEFVGRMKKNDANRTKEGRVLSDANRRYVQDAYDALGKLLDASKPKDDEETDGEKGFNPAAVMLELDVLTADLRVA